LFLKLKWQKTKASGEALVYIGCQGLPYQIGKPSSQLAKNKKGHNPLSSNIPKTGIKDRSYGPVLLAPAWGAP